jgi:hypothetical protein
MAQGSRTDRDVREAIERLALDGYRPAEILRRLPDLVGEANVPSSRVVQGIARRVTPRDTSEDWGVASDPREDAGVLLPFLAELLPATDGHIRTLTQKEAEMIARLLRAVPDLPAFTAYHLARDYMARTEHGQASADLDAYLAFAPWRPGGAERHINAWERGWFQSIHIEVGSPEVYALYTAAKERMQLQWHDQHDGDLERAVRAHYAEATEEKEADQ